MDVMLVYITAGSTDEARSIGRSLVEERLAACANVLPQVTSMYWWQSAVQEETETVLVVKTQRARLEKLTDRVRKLHSYDCPCVVALPISDGNKDFLDWIVKETTP